MKEEETLEPTWVHSSCFQGAARRGRRSPNQAGQDPGVQAPVTFQFLVEGGVGMYSSSDSKRFCSLVSLGSLNRVIKLCWKNRPRGPVQPSHRGFHEAPWWALSQMQTFFQALCRGGRGLPELVLKEGWGVWEGTVRAAVRLGRGVPSPPLGEAGRSWSLPVPYSPCGCPASQGTPWSAEGRSAHGGAAPWQSEAFFVILSILSLLHQESL